MKISTLLLLSILLFSQASASGSIKCEGKVTRILDWGTKCSSLDPVSGVQVPRLAYKIYSTDHQADSKNVKSNQWLCSNSEQSDALIMGAYFSGREVGVRVSSTSCGDLGGDYYSPQYLYLND